MDILVPVGWTVFGMVLGLLIEERLWHLVYRPLPRSRRRRGTVALPGQDRKRGEPSGGGIPSSAAVPTVPFVSLVVRPAARYVRRGSRAVGSLDVPGQFRQVR